MWGNSIWNIIELTDLGSEASNSSTQYVRYKGFILMINIQKLKLKTVWTSKNYFSYIIHKTDFFLFQFCFIPAVHISKFFHLFQWKWWSTLFLFILYFLLFFIFFNLLLQEGWLPSYQFRNVKFEKKNFLNDEM